MRTPKEYSDNLKNRIINDEMLEAALFSVNKRAKNWRDKKREYRHRRYDKYHNAEKAEGEEKKMYERKEKLLTQLHPICIHKEFAGYERNRVYDYEDDYLALFIREAYRGTIVWMNSYIEKDNVWGYEDIYDWWDDDYSDGHRVCFFDYEDRSAPTYRYYLFYMLGEHSFHTPITAAAAEKEDLPSFVIDTLATTGHEHTDLISVQFVDKLIALINSGDYQRVGESTEADYIRGNIEEERNRCKQSTFCQDENEISLYAYWGSISSYMQNYIEAIYPTLRNKVILTREQKEQIEESIKGKISKYLSDKGYSLSLSNKKGRKIRRSMRKHRFHDDDPKYILDNFMKESADYFSGDKNVTIEKLCDLYISNHMDYIREYREAKAVNDYISSKEQSWKDQVLSQMKEKIV